MFGKAPRQNFQIIRCHAGLAADDQAEQGCNDLCSGKDWILIPMKECGTD